jgi:hypothetical protein
VAAPAAVRGSVVGVREQESKRWSGLAVRLCMLHAYAFFVNLIKRNVVDVQGMWQSQVID